MATPCSDDLALMKSSHYDFHTDVEGEECTENYNDKCWLSTNILTKQLPLLQALKSTKRTLH